MKGKILFVAGLGVGYVLGTRAGRQRFEQIKTGAAKFWNDPQVQERVTKVEDFVKDKAPEVAEFVADSAKKVVHKATATRRSSTQTRSPEATSASE